MNQAEILSRADLEPKKDFYRIELTNQNGDLEPKSSNQSF